MMKNTYSIFELAHSSGQKHIVPLIDPDKTDRQKAGEIGEIAQSLGIPLLLVGGSLITQGNVESTVQEIKKEFSGAVVLFPGHSVQVCEAADGILFLSLISGRNPELLIGQQVVAAPIIKKAGLECIPTGYMLIESGKTTSAAYMSQTVPIPYQKDEIAACTALAGEMLGLKCIYLEAGSGAETPVSASMIKAVKEAISIPLIVGGGIRTEEDARKAAEAGADILIVGNLLEKTPDALQNLISAINS